MSALVVVGASGCGREVLDIVEAINCSLGEPRYHVRGVVDDNPSDLNRDRLRVRGYEWLGTVDQWIAEGNQEEYVIGIGSPQIRKAIVDKIADRHQPVEPLIHPTAIIGSLSTIGRGAIICPGAILTTNITIGRHSIINFGATVGHDTTIGDYVTVNPVAAISGSVTLEDEVLVGAHAVILEGRTVGKMGIVGAAACVVKSVAPGVTVRGVPAHG